MKHRGIVVSLAALGAFACGAPAPDNEQGDEPVGEMDQALLGAATIDQSCVSQNRDDEAEQIARYGRVISRSNAFGECARTIFAQATELPLTNPGNPYGPYVPCGTGSEPTSTGHVCSTECANLPLPAGSDCHCDPILFKAPRKQRARILFNRRFAASHPADLPYESTTRQLSPSVESGNRQRSGKMAMELAVRRHPSSRRRRELRGGGRLARSGPRSRLQSR